MALPIAAWYQTIVGAGAEAVVHVVLVLGAGLLAFAVFDLRTAGGIAWTGCAAASVMAAMFLLPAVSEVTRSQALTHFVYRVLGHPLEGWVANLVLLWCLAVALMDSRGKTRIVWLLLEATSPRPCRRGLSPLPTCSHFEEQSTDQPVAGYQHGGARCPLVSG